MTKRALTHKQEAVLRFIERYLAEYRRSPLIREIQQGCEIVSYKSTLDRLNALEHKEYIARIPNKHRGISLLRSYPESQLVPVEAPSLEGAV